MRRQKQKTTQIMKTKFFVPVLMMIAVAFSSCSTETTGLQEMNLKFDFSKEYQGWTYDMSNYVEGEKQSIALACKYTRLPQPLNTEKSALLISAKNQGGDLFFYIRRQVTGLMPSTQYAIHFNMELASNAPSTNQFGNADDVHIKVGASANEPRTIKTGNVFNFSLDKGVKKDADGADLKVIGSLGNGTTEPVYTLFEKNSNNKSIVATTDEMGNLWLVVGFDSNYKSRTSLFISRLNIQLQAL